MKLYTPDNDVLIDIKEIKRDGNSLLINGKIMGTMPMQACLRPNEVRKIFRLVNFRTLLFILSLPFRR